MDIIEGKNLTLDEFLECLFSNKCKDLYPNNFFPTEEMETEFLQRVHSYSDCQIKNILRKFLVHNGFFGKDEFTFQWIDKHLKEKKNVKKILSIEYFRKLIIHSKNPDYNVWEGLTWILDLLPESPKFALNALDAYLVANWQFLPDNWIDALYECRTIIRAKYIDYEHPENVFNDISPIDFENLVARLYEEIGYEIETTKRSYDNGVDIYIIKKEVSQKEKAIIQCKRYTTQKIGVSEVRNLLGVISNEKSTKGILVTSSLFTKESYKLMEKNPRLELIDCKNLVRLLNENFGPYWIDKIDRIIGKDKTIKFFLD